MEKIKTKDRIIHLYKDISEESVSEVVQKIREIESNDKDFVEEIKTKAKENGYKVCDIEIPPITLYLSTYGGEVYSGFGLYEAIRNCTSPIEIICEGKVMSCGVLVMLGSKVRKAYKTTTFMIHDISCWMYGKLKACEERIEQTKRLNDLVWETYEQETKFPRKLYDEIMNCKKDYYISAERALELGLITELI